MRKLVGIELAVVLVSEVSVYRAHPDSTLRGGRDSAWHWRILQVLRRGEFVDARHHATRSAHRYPDVTVRIFRHACDETDVAAIRSGNPAQSVPLVNPEAVVDANPQATAAVF